MRETESEETIDVRERESGKTNDARESDREWNDQQRE